MENEFDLDNDWDVIEAGLSIPIYENDVEGSNSDDAAVTEIMRSNTSLNQQVESFHEVRFYCNK